MKQYKLTSWPELPARLQKTTMRRVVSELSQRFVSVRDLTRTCGATPREVQDLVQHLQVTGMLMTRDAPQALPASPGSWRDWGPVAVFRGLVRSWR